MNARFWIFWNDDMIKITLKPGQEINLATGRPCDEGWSREYQTYRHDGDHVTSELLNEGRDCDGFCSNYGQYKCRIEQLDGFFNDYNQLNMPIWHRVDSCCRDQFAESMGY